MNGTPDILAGLRDIVAPAPPPVWPPAPGWWLIGCSAAAIALLVWMRAKKRLARSARTAALKQFSRIAALPAQPAIAELSTLMRRAAMTKFPRTDVAALTGRDWLEFLDQSGATDQFCNGPGRILASAPYQNQVAEQCDGAIALCRQWIVRVL